MVKSINEPDTPTVEATEPKSINEPEPNLVLVSLDPPEMTLGEPDADLHVIGAGFTEDCVITLDEALVSTTFISATELTTTIPTSTSSEVGTWDVSVVRGAEMAEPHLHFSLVAPPEP